MLISSIPNERREETALEIVSIFDVDRHKMIPLQKRKGGAVCE